MRTDWHRLSLPQIFQELNTAASGLSAEEAARRLAEDGSNQLQKKAKRTLGLMFLDQFKDFMIVVLIVAAVIAGWAGDPSDSIAIVVIVMLNAVIGFVQEYRAEKAMEALQQMTAPTATVLREEGLATIPAAELVRGDLVLLEAGRIVPADLRLVEAVRLKIEEAALTGESVPAEKQSEPLAELQLAIGDRRNMAYKGTFVTYGRGTGIVTATGMNTELGQIAKLLQDEEEGKTPLQKRLAQFGRKLAIAVLVLCVIFFFAGLIRGEPTLLMLLTAISLAVAAIPEALPAVVTIALALGARKMVKQNALIRKLPAVETLGSVNYICSDKTGTLTLNKMTVEQVHVAGRVLERQKSPGLVSASSAEGLLGLALALSNDAVLDKDGLVTGDPTETALFTLAQSWGLDKRELEQKYPRIAEIPFDSERKCMTTIHRWPDGSYVSFTKGALEVLAERTSRIQKEQEEIPIAHTEILAVGETMAAAGLRVLGIALRRWPGLPEAQTAELFEQELTLLGIVGLIDPPREEVKEAVGLCRTAGIQPVMITGDHPATALAIARRLGIVNDGEEAVITGQELERLSLPEFEQRVEHIRIYARVAPEQKLKIIRALQDKGNFVAMTGDGVNDAPALKRADIGVAMGITGTDVAKEAAHMILLDDNFATIVKSVKEGRRIFDNIRKFIKYTMTSNAGELWTLFLAPFLGLPIPLLPIHLLWINIVTDGLPGLALAAEPAEKGVMQKPPRHPNESIFAHGLGRHIIWVGLLMGLVSIGAQAGAIHGGIGHWQTMVFVVLCLSQMGHVLAIRSERESLFQQGLRSNKPLLAAFTLTLILQLATVYVPFLNPIFHTAPLTWQELLITLGLSLIVFIAVEIEKAISRNRRAGIEEQ